MKRVCLAVMLVGLASGLSAQSHRSVLVRAAQPYDSLVRAIEQAGGNVTYRFTHVKGIAAEVPEAALASLESLVGPDNIGRDEIIPLPTTTDPRGGFVQGEAEADDMVTLDAPSKVPTADANDQGAGFVNAAAALALLQAGDVEDSYDTAPFTRNLKANMERAGHKVYAGPRSLRFEGVRPAQVTDIPFVVSEKTEQLFVRIHSIAADLPLAQQNPFFTDDVFLKIQSSVVHNDDQRQGTQPFLVAGSERLYTFTRPVEGIWRIAPAGDWTNAGTVAYSVDIWTTKETFPEQSAKAKIGDGESQVYTFDVPAGTAALETRLTWMNMNGNYPISDVDVILTPPSGPVVNTCNTGRTPELCVVANPVAGKWTARVVGFSIPAFGVPTGGEHYTLRIEADGVVLGVTKQ